MWFVFDCVLFIRGGLIGVKYCIFNCGSVGIVCFFEEFWIGVVDCIVRLSVRYYLDCKGIFCELFKVKLNVYFGEGDGSGWCCGEGIELGLGLSFC